MEKHFGQVSSVDRKAKEGGSYLQVCGVIRGWSHGNSGAGGSQLEIEESMRILPKRENHDMRSALGFNMQFGLE